MLTCYAPTFAASRVEKDQFFDSLQQALDDVPPSECYVALVGVGVLVCVGVWLCVGVLVCGCVLVCWCVVVCLHVGVWLCVGVLVCGCVWLCVCAWLVGWLVCVVGWLVGWCVWLVGWLVCVVGWSVCVWLVCVVWCVWIFHPFPSSFFDPMMAHDDHQSRVSTYAFIEDRNKGQHSIAKRLSPLVGGPSKTSLLWMNSNTALYCLAFS